MRRQFYDLKVGESVTVDGSVITAEAKSGARVRLKVESNGPIQKGRPEPALARPYTPPVSTGGATAPAAAIPRPRMAER